MSRPRYNTHPLPAAAPDNRSLFDGGDDEAAHYDDAADVAELFGGSTDAATVERVRRGRVAADWGRS